MFSGIDSILFVSHEFGIGGATKSLLSLIKGINQISPEIKCKVLVPLKYGKSSTAYEYFKSNNVDCQRVFYRHDWKKLNQKYSIRFLFFDILNSLAAIRISKIIAKNKYSIICSNSTAVNVGGVASLRRKVPHIQYVREMMEEDFGIEYRNKELMKNIIEKSNGVVFISEFVRNKYISKFNILDNVIFHVGIDTSYFYNNHHMLFEGEGIKIIQIGALKDGKGAKSTIRIIKGIKDKGINNVQMLFVGDVTKQYRAEMMELIEEYNLSDNVRIQGFTKDVKKFMDTADILIMNSMAEGFGRVTVEAMAAGCLIIGRNAGGTKEIIDNEKTGVLFENDNDAVNKVLRILNDKDVYVNVARAGQKYAIENYSVVSTSKKFLAYCEMILK